MRLFHLKQRARALFPRLYGTLREVRQGIEARKWKRFGREPLPMGELVVPSVHRAKERLIRRLARRHQIKLLVETGTFQGDMAFALAGNFDRIWTVELDHALWQASERRLAGFPNVCVLHGSSTDLLPKVLADMDGPGIFFLDANNSGGITTRGDKETPVLEDLRAIFASDQGHVVLVDDAWWHDGTLGKPTEAEVIALVAAVAPRHCFRLAGEVMVFEPPR